MKPVALALAAGLFAVLAAPAPILAMGGDSPSVAKAAENPDYANGKKAVDEKDYQVAINHLTRSAEKNPKDADTQNLLGFSHRKLGNFDKAFEHYRLALTIDPKHRGAHEYIGEAYLETKQLAKAEEHLKALENLCAICAERRDLDRAIKDYKRKNNIS